MSSRSWYNRNITRGEAEELLMKEVKCLRINYQFFFVFVGIVYFGRKFQSWFDKNNKKTKQKNRRKEQQQSQKNSMNNSDYNIQLLDCCCWVIHCFFFLTVPATTILHLQN